MIDARAARSVPLIAEAVERMGYRRSGPQRMALTHLREDHVAGTTNSVTVTVTVTVTVIGSTWAGGLARL